MDPEALPSVARHVARLIVEGRFKELEAASGGVRLSAREMEEAVSEIGSSLAMPPKSHWQDLDAVAVRNAPGTYSVRFDLWTTAGKSDWSVELTLYSKNGKPVIEVDDIHVL